MGSTSRIPKKASNQPHCRTWMATTTAHSRSAFANRYFFPITELSICSLWHGAASAGVTCLLIHLAASSWLALIARTCLATTKLLNIPWLKRFTELPCSPNRDRCHGRASTPAPAGAPLASYSKSVNQTLLFCMGRRHFEQDKDAGGHSCLQPVLSQIKCKSALIQ